VLGETVSVTRDSYYFHSEPRSINTNVATW